MAFDVEQELREELLKRDHEQARLEKKVKALERENLQYKDRVSQVERILYDMTQAGSLADKLAKIVSEMKNRGGGS